MDSGMNSPASISQQRKTLSGAERQKRYREKLKREDPEFKLKENKRIEARRKEKVAGMNIGSLKNYRKNAAERQKKSRQKKKEELAAKKADVIPSPYRTPQSLGKAIRKSSKALPHSPRKRQVVVQGLAKQVGLQLQKKMNDNFKGKNSISEEVLTAVQKFYYQPDIAYTMPGMKDNMVVRNNGCKEVLRKYYLIMYLKEAYAVFQSLHPDCKIGFTKFTSLRPANVLLLKQSPIDQCKCRTHENFILKLRGLGIKYGTDQNPDFWADILCDKGLKDNTSDCWKGKCFDCKDGKKIDFGSEESMEFVKWQQWDTLAEEERLRKVTYEGTADELQATILKTLPSVQEHVRVKRIQSNAFEADKKDDSTRILQMDFAMGYSCEYQDEVQSALWHRGSVTLFTAASFYHQKVDSYLICSNTHDKGKDSVFTFVTRLYDLLMLKDNDLDIKEVIYTDGPSSEFKNRYAMTMLQILSEKYKKDFTWKYFATSHGKGVVDGIGRRAKYIVRQRVMSKSEDACIVEGSADFTTVAAKFMPDTNVLHVTQGEIDQFVTTGQPWNQTEATPGIRKIHVATYSYERKCLNMFETAEDICRPAERATVSNNTVPTAGEWWIVQYDDIVYPGEIINQVGDSFAVSVMVKAGESWKWPQPKDIILYTKDKLRKNIAPPIPVGSGSRLNLKTPLEQNNRQCAFRSRLL